jgi:hypothetical protein
MPQASLGFALQSLPLSESRAAFRRPFAPLRVRDRSQPGAKAPEISDRFRQRTPPQPPRAIPCGSRSDRWWGSSGSPRPSCQAAVSERASCPARPSSTTTGTFGHHRLTADSPATKLCSPRESVHRPTAPLAEARAPELAPPRAATDRVVALLGFRPFRAYSATTSGSELCESRPGRTGRSSEDHAPLRTAESGASILRSRISGTSRGAGWPPDAPRRQTLRASAPPYGRRPCLSCPLSVPGSVSHPGRSDFRGSRSW